MAGSRTRYTHAASVEVLKNPSSTYRVVVKAIGYKSIEICCDSFTISNPFASDRYSEGGSGEYINNSRFEPAQETDNAA